MDLADVLNASYFAQLQVGGHTELQKQMVKISLLAV